MLTLENVGKWVGECLDPLVVALEASDGDIQNFVSSLGWTLPSVPQSLKNLQTSSKEVVSSLSTVEEMLISLKDSEATEDDVLQALGLLLLDVSAFAIEIHKLPEALKTELDPAYIAWTHIADEIEHRIFDYCAISSLESEAPGSFQALVLLGIIERTPMPEDQNLSQPAFTLDRIRWDRIPLLFKDPSALLKEVYGWGTPTLDTSRLFEAAIQFSTVLGFPAYLQYPSAELFGAVASGAVVPDEGAEPLLLVPIFNAGPIEVSIGVYPSPKISPSDNQPIALTLVVAGEFSQTFDLTPSTKVEITEEIDIGSGLAVVLDAGKPPQLMTHILDAASSPFTQGMLKARLAFGDTDSNERTKVFSVAGGSGLEVGQSYLELGAGGGPGQGFDIMLEAGINQGRVTVKAEDGFLAKVLPADGLTVDFDFAAGWSRARGIYFKGSAGLEVTIPINLSILDVLEIDSIYVGAFVDGSGFTLKGGTSVTVTLGPVLASVDQVGIQASVTFPDGGGNFGKANVALGFKPPNGVGIQVDASGVTGGGYLFFDFHKEQYAGVLLLSIEDTVTIKATGIVTTKMPDGSRGFSMLFLVSAEFSPIQLAFGFTLNGVGGLAGINRTIMTDALQAGIKNHSVDSIMFPPDPIQHAKEIISNLNTFFPPAEGRYLFAPMIMIGWGTPTLVKAELGVIIELPAPIVIVVLGQIRALLPTQDAAIIEIHLDVIGILDFGKKQFSLDASMHDSRIAAFSMYGDMAMRLSWGDTPSFAFSVGGLNPHFQPPANFPTLKRFTVCLSTGDNPKLGLQSYFAVTSNTFQTGAAASLYAKFGSFEVDGHIGFDALFNFDPFSFTVDFSAGISIKYHGTEFAGIHLDATLTGPSPWHAWGTASISLLFFSIGVHVDVTIGEKQDVALPLADPTDTLYAALADPRNWSGRLVEQCFQVVTLKTPDVKVSQGSQATPPPTAFIDPCCELQVKETVVPLDFHLTQIGETKPVPGKDYFSIQALSVSGITLEVDPNPDLFASAQFTEMSDDEKLSHASFDTYHAGIKTRDDLIAHGGPQQKDFDYDTEVLDTQYTSRFSALYSLRLSKQVELLGVSAAAQAPFRNLGSAKFEPSKSTPSLMGVSGARYVVSTTSDLSIRADILANASTKIQATQALKRYLLNHPQEIEHLQVLATEEAAG